MSSVSTFGAFTTARLAIYSTSKSLDVVGNNIANINTTGYTRQATDQVSMYVGSADKYRTAYDARVGNGALVTHVTQLRDPYLDIRYRNEMSSVGYYDAKLYGLDYIANYLDEVGKGEDGEGILEDMFNNFLSQMTQLVDNPGNTGIDTVVRSAANSLVLTMNQYADQLNTLYDNQMDAFEQDLTNVNSILDQIRDLNSAIRKSQVYGGDALEQKDARNLLIDELSNYVRVNVSYETEDLGDGLTVEKLVIRLGGNDASDPANNTLLVDGIYSAKLEADMEDGNLSMTVTALRDKYGSLDKLVQNKTEVMTGVEDANTAIQKAYQDAYDASLAGADGSDSADAVKAAKAAGKAAAEAELAKQVEEHETTFPTTGSDAAKSYRYSYSLTTDAEGKYVIQQTTETYSASVDLKDNTLYGSIQAEREMLTEQGEYATAEQIAMDPDATSKRGYKYYMKALDTLANQFANTLNAANAPVGVIAYGEADADNDIPYDAVFQLSDGTYAQLATKTVIDPNTGESILMFNVTNTGCYMWNDNVPVKTDKQTEEEYKAAFTEWLNSSGVRDSIIQADGMMTAEQKAHFLPDTQGGLGHGALSPVDEADLPEQEGGVLFTNGSDDDSTAGITAANISISNAWSIGDVRIKQSNNVNHGSTENDNLTHIFSLLTSEQGFTTTAADLADVWDDVPEDTDTQFFKGTFQEFFRVGIMETLADDQMTTTTMLNNYTTSANELYVERDSVSGVDLNDEAMNLIQYQKSYQAACRLMTVIDSTLDKLINGTAV